MPEGHVTHRLAAEHLVTFGDRVVHASSPQGRFEAGAAAIDGRVLTATHAYGKHLFHHYTTAGQPPEQTAHEPQVWLHVHLGLYGRFTTGPQPAPTPGGQLRLRLETDTAWADLTGPTACDVLDHSQVQAIIDRLGPDPLRDDDPELAWERIRRSRRPIAALMMDQSVLSGVGNAFRAELLFRHLVHPHTPGRDLLSGTWPVMWLDLRTLMRAAMRSGQIVTTRPRDRPPAERGRKPIVTLQNAHYVYRRTGLPCRWCRTPILTDTLEGRNLFWCPTCQAS